MLLRWCVHSRPVTLNDCARGNKWQSSPSTSPACSLVRGPAQCMLGSSSHSRLHSGCSSPCSRSPKEVPKSSEAQPLPVRLQVARWLRLWLQCKLVRTSSVRGNRTKEQRFVSLSLQLAPAPSPTAVPKETKGDVRRQPGGHSEAVPRRLACSWAGVNFPSNS